MKATLSFISNLPMQCFLCKQQVPPNQYHYCKRDDAKPKKKAVKRVRAV